MSAPSALLFCGILRVDGVEVADITPKVWLAQASLQTPCPPEYFKHVQQCFAEKQPTGKQDTGVFRPANCTEVDVRHERDGCLAYVVITNPGQGALAAHTLLCAMRGEVRNMTPAAVAGGGPEAFAHIGVLLEEVFRLGGPISRPMEIALTVNGSVFAGLIRGPLDGIKVLGFHGWMDNAASLTPLNSLLAGRGMFTVALDCAGHGRSTHRNYQFYDTPSLACDVYDCVGALNWRACGSRFHIVGHSMGASIAVVFAASFPDLVEKVVLLDGIGPLSIERSRTVAAIRSAAEVRADLRTKAPREYPSVRAAALRLRETASMDIQSAITIASRATRETNGSVAFTHDICLRAPSPRPFGESQVIEIIQSISSPVMVMVPDKGIPFPRDWMESRFKKFQRILVVPCVGGHHFHIDNAPSIVDTVFNFLLGVPINPPPAAAGGPVSKL